MAMHPSIQALPTGTGAELIDVRRWSPTVRDLFRSALRSARAGNRVVARQQVEELLAMAPGTVKAVRLKTWLDESPAPLRPDSELQQLVDEVQESWSEPTPVPPAWRESGRGG